MSRRWQYVWLAGGAALGGFLLGVYRFASPPLAGALGGVAGGLLGAGAYELLKRPWRAAYRWAAALGVLIIGFGALWLLGGVIAATLGLATSAGQQYRLTPPQ